MSNIITITLSPAVDKSATVPVLIPDKKMKCSDPVFEPGGGGINVARAIRKLGGNALALYLAGGNTGRYLTGMLKDEGIDTAQIETASETRENLSILDLSSGLQYRFGMPGAFIEPDELKQLLGRVRAMGSLDYMVLSGSVPPGVPKDIFARLASIGKEKGARVVLDTSGEALREGAHEGVYLLKPNMAEISALMGEEKMNDMAVEDMAYGLLERGNCEILLLSMGAGGALLLTREETIRLSSPALKVRSTVGAGDSMVAGMVYSLSLGKTAEEAAKYAVACGAAATMNPGTELCKRTDVDRLIHRVHCHRIRQRVNQ